MILATLYGCKSYKKIQILSKSHFSDLDMLGKVKAMVMLFNPGQISEFDNTIEQHAGEIVSEWPLFLEANSDKVYQKTTVLEADGEKRTVYKRARSKMRAWINSSEFEERARAFFIQKTE